MILRQLLNPDNSFNKRNHNGQGGLNYKREETDCCYFRFFFQKPLLCLICMKLASYNNRTDLNDHTLSSNYHVHVGS